MFDQTFGSNSFTHLHLALVLAAVLYGQSSAAEYNNEEIDFDSSRTASEWLKDIASTSNQEIRSRLEKCVTDLGLVEFSEITPLETGNLITVRVNNVTDIPITGLIVRSEDMAMKLLDLDGRAIIEFDPIAPGESRSYLEEVLHIQEFFPKPTKVKIVALDVIDIQGVRIIDDLFMARWPNLKSQEDLNFTVKTFCEKH